MEANNLPFQAKLAPYKKNDPGSAGTIVADRTPCYVPLVTAGAETRTLSRPTKKAQTMILYAKTIVTSCTVTITGGYNTNGDTTYAFTASGQYLVLMSFYTGSAYVWMAISSGQLGNLTALTATVAQLNVVANPASKSRTSTTTDSITAADHNGIIFLNSATGYVTTLPAPVAGFCCTIISKLANTSGNHTVVTASSANIINGDQNSVAGDAGDSGTTDDTISFVANQSVAGDKVELFSDGTTWFAYAISRVAAGVTFTTAS